MQSKPNPEVSQSQGNEPCQELSDTKSLNTKAESNSKGSIPEPFSEPGAGNSGGSGGTNVPGDEPGLQ